MFCCEAGPLGGGSGRLLAKGPTLRRSMCFIAVLFNVGTWFAFMNVLSARDELQHRMDSFFPTNCTVTANAEVQRFVRPGKTTKYRAFVGAFYRDQHGTGHSTDLYSSGGNDPKRADYSATFPTDFVSRFRAAKGGTFGCYFDPGAPKTLKLALPTEEDVAKVLVFAVLIAVLGGGLGCLCVRRSLVIYCEDALLRERDEEALRQQQQRRRQQQHNGADNTVDVQVGIVETEGGEELGGFARKGSRNLYTSSPLPSHLYRGAKPSDIKHGLGHSHGHPGHHHHPGSRRMAECDNNPGRCMSAEDRTMSAKI